MSRHKTLLVLICSFWLHIMLAPAMSIEPEISLWTNPPTKKILANGLTLICQRDESSRITVLYLFVRGGKRSELQAKRGLAYLTTRLAIEIPDRRIAQSLMSQATRITMGSNSDYSYIRIACLTESLADTLKTMSKIIFDPLFSGIRIDHVKETMEYQKKRNDDDALVLAHQALIDAFLTERGYGGSALGSEESLKNIKKRDINDYYKNFYRGSNMVLAVCSDLEEKRILNICSDHFSKFPEGSPPPIKIEIPALEDKQEIFIAKDSLQAVISYGFSLPNLTQRDFALNYLLETLLGRGIGSRLWPLRAEEKLAYNVGARATQLKEGGIIEIYLETDNTKREEAVAALEKTIGLLFEEGITEEELRATKNQSKSSFLRANETKGRRAFNLGFFESHGLGFEFLNGFFQEIEEITLDEMNTYIKAHLEPGKRVQVVVGTK